jgi:hypothetical protein
MKLSGSELKDTKRGIDVHRRREVCWGWLSF